MTQSSRFAHSLTHACLFVTTAVLLALAELSPRRFERVMQEDGWAEWATVGALASAAVLALIGVRRMRGWTLARVCLLGLCAFALFVAGEEISWGQRLLGFRPPNLFLEHNYQQESNLHNLLKDVLDTRWMVFSVCVLYGVLAPYVVYVTRAFGPLAAERSLLPWFALVAWLEFAYPYELVGELAELLLALLILVDVVARTAAVGVRDAPSDVPRAALWQVVALASGVLLAPLNELALRGHDDTLTAHTAAELARLGERLRDHGAASAKLFERRAVHKRVYTAVTAGYLELDPSQYYLDAWNSPYWIAFRRLDEGHGSVTLSSFGPNRRRDERDGAPSGDDVTLTFELTAPARADR